MKIKKNNRSFRISLAVLALGVSGLFVYDTVHRPTKFDTVSSPKDRLSPRKLSQQTAQSSSTAGDRVRPDLAIKPPAPPLFHEFNDWAVQYSKATPVEQQRMLVRGETMVKKRHEQMAGLIEKSPQVALAESDALSPLAREALPESLKSQLEQRVNARGDISVMAYVGKDVAPYVRSAIFDGNEYTFYPSTENEMIWPESNRSLLGITLAVNRVVTGKDGKQYPQVEKLMALRRDRVRVLSTEEAAVAAESHKEGTESVCEVSAKSVAKAPVPAAIETGGDTKFMCEPAHTTAWLNSPAGIAASGAPDRFAAVGGPGEGSGGATPVGGYYPRVRPSTGQLTCVVAKLRCAGQAAYSKDVSAARMDPMFTELAKSANNTVSFAPMYITEDLLLPGTASDYFYSTTGRLKQDSTAALNKWMTDRGLNLENFRFHVVCVEGAMQAGGGASIGGQYVEINVTTNPCFQHEIGHIVGLPHANLWAPSSADPIGDGILKEYLGSYNTMGNLEMDWAGYSTMDRFFIGWLPFAQVHDLTSRVSGDYQIFDPDITSLNSNRKYSIRVPRSDGSHYFVEFRPNATALGSNGREPLKYPVNETTKNGIRILRSKDSAQLDLTPLSAGGSRDGALVSGQEFFDATENVVIKAVGQGYDLNDGAKYFVVKVTFNRPTVAVGRTYMLRARDGGLIAGVANSSSGNGGQVTQQNQQNSANQKWALMKVDSTYYKLVNVNSGKILEVAGNSKVSGGLIQQWDYVGAYSQKWQIVATDNGYFKLINNGSGLALTTPYPQTTAGIQLQQFYDDNAPDQHWSFEEVSPLNSGSNYSIKARHSGKALDVAGSSTANGTYIYQWAAVSYAPFQKWTASAQGGATLALTNVGSQKVLEVGGYATSDGSQIQQWQWAAHDFQKWRLEVSDQDTAGFWYKLVNVGSGKVADVSGVSVADGARLTQYSSWGGYNQQFRFTAAP